METINIPEPCLGCDAWIECRGALGCKEKEDAGEHIKRGHDDG